MTKRWIAIIIAVALLFGIGLPVVTRGYYNVSYISGSLAYFDESFKAVEERARSVVVGRVLNDAKTIFSVQNSLTPDYGRPLFNVVSLEITRVIKGDFSVGDTIRITEPYYINGGTLVTFGNYLPSKPNHEYVYFLGRQQGESLSLPEGVVGAYHVDNLERGRYLVPNDNRSNANDFTRSELSLGRLDTDIYLQMYQDVINAYIK